MLLPPRPCIHLCSTPWPIVLTFMTVAGCSHSSSVPQLNCPVVTQKSRRVAEEMLCKGSAVQRPACFYEDEVRMQCANTVQVDVCR